jgi:uncharacterized protein DUF4440
MVRFVVVVVALGASRLAAQAVPHEVERQILAARDTVWHAWFANDTVVLQRMLPTAVAAADGGSRWSDRAKTLADARSFAAAGGRLDRIDFANTHISLTGNAAVVTSAYMLVTRSGDRPDTSRGHAVEVFVRQDGHWVNPFWQLASARSAAIDREIPLPDTTGANFSVADSVTATGSPADYDALIGVWEFRFQPRNGDGTFVPGFNGHWTFEKKPGGLLIEDHWRPDNPKSPNGVSTYTYRSFDPVRKIWRIVGMHSQQGGFQLGLTWSDADNRFAVQHDGNMMVRIRYFALQPNHFLWRADGSADGGKTWVRDIWTMEATRIAQ